MKKGTVIIMMGLLMIAAALFLSFYNLWDERRAEAAARQGLEQLLPEIEKDPVPREGRMRFRQSGASLQPGPGGVQEPSQEGQGLQEDEIEYPDYVLDPNMPMPVKKVDGNSYIGVLSIPSIGLELSIFDKWNYPNLKKSPCRYTGSVYLDDMVICGHNYLIHFRHLKELSYGAEVVFTDMDGNVFRYQVMEIEYLTPKSVDAMIHSEWDLTLFTCTLDGRRRVTVRCERLY